MICTLFSFLVYLIIGAFVTGYLVKMVQDGRLDGQKFHRHQVVLSDQLNTLDAKWFLIGVGISTLAWPAVAAIILLAWVFLFSSGSLRK